MASELRIFISYSTSDEALAQAIYVHLKGLDLNTKKAPEDIPLGCDWPSAITEMIESATHMVLVWTSESMKSKEVAKELTLAMQSGTQIIPFKAENLSPSNALRYHLANLQWLDAHQLSQEEALKHLSTQITESQKQFISKPSNKKLTSQEIKKSTKPLLLFMLSIFALGFSVILFRPKIIDQLKTTKAKTLGSGEELAIMNPQRIDLAIETVQKLYVAISRKDWGEARRRLNDSSRDTFDPEFFEQFKRVSVNDIRLTSVSGSTINLEAFTSYFYPNGRVTRERRSFTVKTSDNQSLITSSEFISVVGDN